MADKGFVEFIKVNGEDRVELLALKSQHNMCVAWLALATMKGRHEHRQDMLTECSF
jgi:hypothetical protein